MNANPEKRMMALAIGISNAEPLPYLRGAINGATQFHNWAETVGYDSQLLTDQRTPVTIDILRDKLKTMLATSSGPPFRLALYFAGHGLIREAEEGLWLLSDWNKELRAVAVEVLKRRLYMYGIAQISIFADACRSLPADMNAADLVADAVLGRGPIPAPSAAAVDKFLAAQDGTSTFMVPGSSPSEDRCLFSGVLMEGLWGSASAISQFFPGKVTSQSLGLFLAAEVPKRALTYKRKLNPIVLPLFPLGSDVYFGDQQPLPTPPAFPPWPDPSVVIGEAAGQGPDPISTLDPPSAPAPDRGKVLHARIENQELPPPVWGTDARWVCDREVREVWTFEGEYTGHLERSDWWWVSARSLNFGATPLLIELQNGVFLLLTVLPGFTSSMICDDRGISSLIYSKTREAKETWGFAARAIAQMESGSLRAESVADMAVELRQWKHADPTLGVISAYLYDSVGDIESIRRMAYFYIQNGQPIPYDIALLAQVSGELDRDDMLRVRIPEVPARLPLTNREKHYEWTYQQTPSAIGVVGGYWPWMRQGWAFLDDRSDLDFDLVPEITALRSQLTSARFATLTAQGGKDLVDLFGFEPRGVKATRLL